MTAAQKCRALRAFRAPAGDYPAGRAILAFLIASGCGGRAASAVPTSQDRAGGADAWAYATRRLDAASEGSFDSPDVELSHDACESVSNCHARACTPSDAVGIFSGDPNSLDPSQFCFIVLGWGWDGAKCVPIAGCSCEGSDCNALLESRSSCVAAYANCLGSD
jgi:hypothetical protein